MINGREISRQRRLELLKLIRDNPKLRVSDLARRFQMREQTVLMQLHRAGYFKVWAKVQEPNSEGVMIR